jgi:hypothetical protein
MDMVATWRTRIRRARVLQRSVPLCSAESTSQTLHDNAGIYAVHRALWQGRRNNVLATGMVGARHTGPQTLTQVVLSYLSYSRSGTWLDILKSYATKHRDERVGVAHVCRVDAGRRPSRPLPSVVLEGDKAERIMADATEFLASERWYAEVCIRGGCEGLYSNQYSIRGYFSHFTVLSLPTSFRKTRPLFWDLIGDMSLTLI